LNWKPRKLLRWLPRNNQKGFTLIELLVVISILGILAAVVTMSMVGVTKLAESRAQTAETASVQAAVDTMANENLVPADQVCNDTSDVKDHGTDDMTQWPGRATSHIDPGTHQEVVDVSVFPTGSSVALSPRYLRQPKTHGTYTCDAHGVVTQRGWTP
jgi:prepilin-type N-terminal cleavage/methylation domain-containing protein